MIGEKRRITYTVDLEAQAQNFNKIIGAAQNQLKQLKQSTSQLTPRQFEQLNQILERIRRNATDIAQKAANGFTSQQGFDDAVSKVNNLSTSYSRFLSELRSFNIDPKKILPDSEEFQKIQAEIRKTEQELKNLKSSKDRVLSDKKFSAMEKEMMAAASQGDVAGVKAAAKKETDKTLGERISLGRIMAPTVKSLGVSKEDLGKAIPTRISEIQEKLQELDSQGKKDTQKGQDLVAEQQNLEKVLIAWNRYIEVQKEVQQINKAKDVYTTKAEQVSGLSQTLQAQQAKAAEIAAPLQQEVVKNLEGLANSEAEVKQETAGMNQELERGRTSFTKLDERTKNMNGLKSYFNSLVSATAILMRLRQAVMQAFRDFKEIDSELNSISIVTGKTMDELWGGFSNLNKIAQEYGVTTKNVIEVQKLYYQQGRNAVEVTQLTGETLKFAKISGLDFANATDYMTAALNAYNIAAKDASTITDTYAALSASAAVDSQEVAVAMSKVASMAAAGGSNFQDTSAYLSKIINITVTCNSNIA